VCPPPRNAAALHADAHNSWSCRADESHCRVACGMTGGALPQDLRSPARWSRPSAPVAFPTQKSYSLQFGAAYQYDVDKPRLSSRVGYRARQNNVADPHNQQNIMANGAHRPFFPYGFARSPAPVLQPRHRRRKTKSRLLATIGFCCDGNGFRRPLTASAGLRLTPTQTRLAHAGEETLHQLGRLVGHVCFDPGHRQLWLLRSHRREKRSCFSDAPDLGEAGAA
jgi:hypothetical protein